MAFPSKLPLYNEKAFQKYHILSDQRDLLEQRLALKVRTTSPGYSQRTPDDHSARSSPTMPRSDYSAALDLSMPFSSSMSHASSAPIPTLPNSTMAPRGRRPSEPAAPADCAEAKALHVLNQEIKATLTELLNTESVRHDDRSRLHVQSQLMAAERELKRQRRRRSVDRYGSAMASSIAEHFEQPSFRFTL